MTEQYERNKGERTACLVKSCDLPVVARKLCKTHYYSLRKYGDPLKKQRYPLTYLDSTSKRCNKCWTVKLLTEFNNSNSTSDKLHSWCRDCDQKSAKEWYHSNKDKARITRKAWQQSKVGTEFHRARALRLRFGLTLEAYDTKLQNQKGCCAACGTDVPGGMGRFHVDHDHDCCPGRKSCGKCVRDLLCTRCNQTLGILRARPGILVYKEKWGD